MILTRLRRQKDMAARASASAQPNDSGGDGRTVKGAPTLKYSQKPIPLRGAPLDTIKFATEPRMVRLPASVVDIASVSHDRTDRSDGP